MSVDAQRVTLADKEVRFYEAGLQHGRTILFVHGGIGDAKQNWRDVMSVFSEDYHVLAPDLPGFGGSADLSDDIDLSDITAWLIQLLDSQGVGQVVAIGSGLGALIVRLMAVQYPQNVAAIVLVNGGFVPNVPRFARLIIGLPVVGGYVARWLANIAISDENLKDMIHHPEVLTSELSNKCGIECDRVCKPFKYYSE